MGQQNSEEGDFCCDSCRKPIEVDRFHCLICKDFDLCLKCKEENKIIGGHFTHHKMIKIFPHFPIDCLSIVMLYTDKDSIQTSLLINHAFYDTIMSLNLRLNNRAVMYKIPKKSKNFISQLHVVKQRFPVKVAKLFPNVIRLDLENCGSVPDKSFEFMPRMESLMLKNCKGFNGSGFVHLRNLKKLTLDFRPKKMTEGIKSTYFKHLHSVEELYVAGGTFKVVNEDFESLKSLKRLILASVSARTDEWGNFFKTVQQVERLEMRKCSFKATDLVPLKSLKYIFVDMSFMVSNHDGALKADITKNVPEGCEVKYKRRQRFYMCM